MKSSTEKPRILLDTSYILPTLGIDTKSGSRNIDVLDGSEVEIYYSRFSILESLWVAARTIQDGTFDPERFALGLRSITEGGRYTRLEEDSEIFTEALKLYNLGHRDMIDNMLYACAARLNLKLFTQDEELKRFVREKKLEYVFFPPE